MFKNIIKYFLLLVLINSSNKYVSNKRIIYVNTCGLVTIKA